jgi:hypothetical protein
MDIKGNSNFQELETKVKNFVVAVVDFFVLGNDAHGGRRSQSAHPAAEPR